MRSDILLWSYLHILNRERFQAIKDVYGSLEAAGRHIGEELLIALGCRRETVVRALMRLEEFDEEQYGKKLDALGIEMIAFDDGRYPRQLAEIGDPPIFLSYKGNLSLLEQPCIGIVGTRQMSPYGRRVVGDFVPALVQAKMVTVSGLAQGIDSAVAEETMKAGGKTIAVFGHGLGSMYPRSNERLAEKILSEGGLLLSEYPLDFQPEKFTFPARNRIIAGCTLGTLVCEAGKDSGAIITAELALEYARDVFAVPGQIFDPNYEGCHTLIAKGQAKLVTNAQDILRDIGIIAPLPVSRVSYEPQSDEEKHLLDLLTTMPQKVDDLVERSGLPTSRISAALTIMELAGAVQNVGSGMWVRS